MTTTASSNLKGINLSQNRCQPLRPFSKQRTLYAPVTPGLVASCRSCDRSSTKSGFEQVMHFILESAHHNVIAGDLLQIGERLYAQSEPSRFEHQGTVQVIDQTQ